MSNNFFIEDFTEENYEKLINNAQEKFTFCFFDEVPPSRPHVLWRHDVDFSIHRGLRLAEIEAKCNVKATYFLWLHSPTYNVMERDCYNKVRGIIELGHQIGLHFDQKFYTTQNLDQIYAKIAYEKNILENLFNVPIKAMSFHEPDFKDNKLNIKQDKIVDMVNAYGLNVFDNYKYVSDSDGYWRFDRLFDVIARDDLHKLQVLTHPEWWVPEPIAPRKRIQRCIDGRAAACARNYDNHFLEMPDRINVK